MVMNYSLIYKQKEYQYLRPINQQPRNAHKSLLVYPDSCLVHFLSAVLDLCCVVVGCFHVYKAYIVAYQL